MPPLPSLPDPAHLMDLFARVPDNVRPLMDYTDGLLRSDGELSVGERELIATYVPALNSCTFCTGAHRAYADAPDGHPARGSTPADQGQSYRVFGEKIEKLSKG